MFTNFKPNFTNTERLALCKELISKYVDLSATDQLQRFAARLLDWLFIHDAGNVYDDAYCIKEDNIMLTSFNADGTIESWNDYLGSNKRSAYKYLTRTYQQKKTSSMVFGKELDDEGRQRRLAEALNEVRATESELTDLLTKASR